MCDRVVRRRMGQPFALLAYTYRHDAVHAALVGGLRRAGLCWGEVAPQRVALVALGAHGRGGRDCSDESAPHVRLVRVQLGCGGGGGGGSCAGWQGGVEAATGRDSYSEVRGRCC
jgi:hypothetical protein